MKKKNTIPERVKEPVVRGVAVEVFILALTALYWKSAIPVFILLGDFFIRISIGPRYSPLAIVSRLVIAPLLRFPAKLVMLRPKRFAAGIGFFMSALALLFFYLNQILFMQVTLSILALFSFLEAFFRFCAGCKIFGLLIRLGWVEEDLCEDCVFPGGEGI